MYFEFLDVSIFLRSIYMYDKSNPFNILSFVSFNNNNGRSVQHNKQFSPLPLSHPYFNCLLRLWNTLPFFDLNLSPDTNLAKLKRFLWNHFIHHFDFNGIYTFQFYCTCAKCSASPITPNFKLYYNLI